MSKPKSSSDAPKKKRQERLLQLRDAQRRRRERLKNDHRHFVQIILPANTLQQLGELIAETGETMQQAIARLVQMALPLAAHSPLVQSANEASTREIKSLPNPDLIEETRPITDGNEPAPFVGEVPETAAIPEPIVENTPEQPAMIVSDAFVPETEIISEAVADIPEIVEGAEETLVKELEPTFETAETEPVAVEPTSPVNIPPVLENKNTAQLDLFG